MFISYAQNFEDVILWRALKHVERGFYIDIGAQDPVIDSVSLAFYERGWRGVHVEPNDGYADKLRQARPDEVVIQSAISREAGEIVFFEIPDTGLSTGEEEIARKHEVQGRTVKQVTKPSQPLSAILDSYKDQKIHWLKIDVEGMEDQAIESWVPSGARPWIVVVESTKPNSPESNHGLWEPKLLKLGYELCYFDGLNRFYVSVEHPELTNSFGPGPNFFDDFALSGTASAPFCHKINAEAAGLRSKLSESQNAKVALEAVLAEEKGAKAAVEASLAGERAARTVLEDHLAAVHASTSWKITAPLRGVKNGVSAAGRFGARSRSLAHGVRAWVTLKSGSRPRRVAQRAVTGLAGYVKGRPYLANGARSILRRFPAVRIRLQAVVHNDPELLPAPSTFGWTRDRTDSSQYFKSRELDVSGEPCGVQRVYRQIRLARRHELDNR
ncbi:FkbM family methyltransferase [Bradyrhizobium sp. Leo121]|uniref:FkbM family methyltransferase n=1 Tax=Bradyrhizobium sp. Leo121 TaxID=1571195 RepID=UPI001A936017|nr:FkbM family methyltransferase [Bradyrhizobium sp. Leo121]